MIQELHAYLTLGNVRPEQYGVTPPISKEKPTPQEERLAEDLMKELRIQGTFESDEEARTR